MIKNILHLHEKLEFEHEHLLITLIGDIRIKADRQDTFVYDGQVLILSKEGDRTVIINPDKIIMVQDVRWGDYQ